MEGVLSQEHSEHSEDDKAVCLPVPIQHRPVRGGDACDHLGQGGRECEADRGSRPNIAALHHRGPRSASSTATRMATLQAPPATSHSQVGGAVLPSSGWAKYKNPARPPAVAITPSHSRAPIANPNQIPSTMTKKISSVVKMGWTTESPAQVQSNGLEQERGDHKNKPEQPSARDGAHGSTG